MAAAGGAPRPSVGAVPSPNIWGHPDVYEVENLRADPEQRIESAMREIFDWTGLDVLDVGCGSGFHLPRWAVAARSVTGVEPHPGLVGLARRRTSGTSGSAVLQGSAQRLPLRAASIDMAQARWAYFFGPGCEPGLRELTRVVRRGGVAFVVDNDATTSTFGAWFRAARPEIDPLTVERFWSMHGWTRRPVEMRWRFGSRSELESVVRIEFPRAHADRILAGHAGLEVDYAVNLWWRRF